MNVSNNNDNEDHEVKNKWTQTLVGKTWDRLLDDQRAFKYLRYPSGWSDILLVLEIGFWMIRYTSGWSDILLDDQICFWVTQYPSRSSNILLSGPSVCVCVCARARTCTHARSLQSCLSLCNSMDCSLPGSSVHGIFQTKIAEWVAMSFNRGFNPEPRIEPTSPVSPTSSNMFVDDKISY